MTFVDVCSVGDIPQDGALSVMVDQTAVAMVRTEGEVFAIEDRCSHADVALSEGDVEGCTIECWLHGSAFDLRTGKPTCLPATEPVPIYAVTIQGEGDEARVLVSVTAESPVR
jgi:3-phenylpropionate/trans-cinnamate dioxygenase ferredoxin subunit